MASCVRDRSESLPSAFDTCVHGPIADDQQGRDLAVGEPVADERGDLELARRERGSGRPAARRPRGQVERLAR
jgi:hypothetical protein